MPRLKSFLLPVLLVGTLVLAGCEADAMEEDETTMLMLDLEPVVGSEALSDDPSTVYTVNGQALTFGSARMYLSEITLLREGGQEVALTGESITRPPPRMKTERLVTHTTNDRVVLAKHDAGETRYELGEVPSGAYEGVRFKVGLTGLTNKIDPTQVPESHPLAQQTDKNNHWSWKAGYIYLRIDGLLDLDGDGAVEASGTDGAAWNVHLGTEAFAEMVELDEPFTLEGGEMQDLRIVVDYAALIQDIDFSDPAQRICHTMNNLPVAEKVGADIAGAFLLR